MKTINRPLLLALAPIIFLSATLLSAAAVGAATYYVATNGSDSNPGTLSQPFRTVRKGTSVLRSGDILYIRAGTYNEIILGGDIPSGSAGAHTVIAGYPGENPTIRCSAPCGEYGISISIFNQHITLRDFTIDNINGKENGKCLHLGSPGDQTAIGLTCLNGARDGIAIRGSNTTVRNSTVRNCGRIQPQDSIGIDTKGIGIAVLSEEDNGSQNILIEDTLVDGCRGGGISVAQHTALRNITLRNNILRNFGIYSPWPPPPGHLQSGVGISIGHGSAYYIYNNVIYRIRSHTSLQDAACIHSWASPNNIYIYSNTCYDSDDGLAGYIDNLTYRNNILSMVSKPVSLSGAGNTGSNNLINPDVALTFVNAANGNFSLLAGSPAVDAGANLAPLVTHDINSFARPQGCCYDIGAYEFGSSGTTFPPPAPSALQAVNP